MRQSILTDLTAVFAYWMRRFGKAQSYCVAASEQNRTQSGRLVWLILSFPCFYLSHWFFWRAYTCQNLLLTDLRNETNRLKHELGYGS